MAVYVFDSSGIIKRYVSETGSAWVNRITDPMAGHQIYLACITGAEVVSAVVRRQRGSTVSAADAGVMLGDFRWDFTRQYRKIAITARLIADAMTLAEVHAVRGYESVQLAAALHLHHRWLARRRSRVVLVSADAALNAAAMLEGLAVDDPNAHP